MTNRRLGAIAGVLLARSALFALAHSPAPPPAPHLDKLRLLPPVLVSGEKGWSLAERMRKHNVEAVSVAVIEGGRVVWAEAAGLADREAGTRATAETLFQAGSISKPVTAAAVMKEVEAGALSLDRDVNDYLKSWKLPPPPAGVAAGPPVTLARLLSHRAGLTVHGFPGYEAGEPVPSVPHVLDGAAPANTEPVRIGWPTGSKYQYSGGGYTIAQLVLTDTLGKPFPEILRERVLAPAGMTHSTYEQPLPPARLASAAAGYRADGKPIPGKRHTYPEMAAAGLWTTAEDLARFAIAIQRSLAGEKGALLSKESARLMTTPLGKNEPGLGLFMETHEGLTWFGHDGADEGFQALLLASRDGDCRCGIAVMANSDNGVRLAREIVRGVAQMQKWKYMPPPIQVTKLSASDLAGVPGRYRIHGDEAVTISAANGRLVGNAGTPGEFELYPVSQDSFVRTDRPLRYEVERGADGRASRLDFAEPGNKALAVATRMPDGERLPSDDLNAGRLDDALAGYRRLKAESPDDPGASAGWLNELGYRLFLSGRKQEGLAILKLATALYPAPPTHGTASRRRASRPGTGRRHAPRPGRSSRRFPGTRRRTPHSRSGCAPRPRSGWRISLRQPRPKNSPGRCRKRRGRSTGRQGWKTRRFDMRYLLLIYDREVDWAGMPEPERGKLFAEYGQFTESIKKSGHYIGGDPLQPTATATTVRVRAGKTATTDGPFAETREQLGGYYKIEAKDLDEASAIAARIPSARMGSIEVRPIMEMGGS